MIDVRVRKHDRVDLVDRARKPGILLARFTASTLEHPAVQQHGPSADPKHVTGAGHFTCGTSELDLHRRPRRCSGHDGHIQAVAPMSTAAELLLQLAGRAG